MQNKAKLLLISIAGIVAVLICAFYADIFHVYTLRDDNGGQILWNTNEAYLFMSVVRRGYRSTWPAYSWGILEQWFNTPPLPSDQQVFLTVIRVTSSGVERHVVRIGKDTASVPGFFTPAGGAIYANCQGSLCRWASDNFEHASLEEERKLGGISQLVSDIDTNTNGWSKRGIGQVAGHAEFSVEIGKELTLRIRQGDVYRSLTDSATVELYRIGQPPQVLWRVNGDPRRVSKREYERSLSTVGEL